ncbi:MAG: hypothetical protein WC746_03255 [archaeon]
MIVKKFALAALLLVILAALPMAFAEDTNFVIDANTAQEIKVMTTPFGAEVRLLQLEKSVTKNVLIGAKVVEIIQKNHPDSNVSEAQNILNLMESLVSDIQNVTLSTDKNTQVAEFIAMKNEATTLSKQFREATAPALDSNDKKEIKDAVEGLDKTELKAINEEIKQAIRSNNAQTIEALLQKMGVTNPELIQKIADGNASAGQVKQALMNAYRDLNGEQKQIAGAKIKEGAIKRMIAEKEIFLKANKNAMDQIIKRTQTQLQRASEWAKNSSKDANANGFEQRAKRLRELSNDLAHASQRINPHPQGNGTGGN